MAATQHVLLSPAELAFLHSSLSLSPPVRLDGRAPTEFRPLVAETGVLLGDNGSARVCFADGTEAIVGVKAEVARTIARGATDDALLSRPDADDDEAAARAAATGGNDWVEMSVEIPGYRDDDASTAFLAAMLSEALLADGTFVRRLWINRRYHWKLYMDVRYFPPPSMSLYRSAIGRRLIQSRRFYSSHLRYPIPSRCSL